MHEFCLVYLDDVIVYSTTWEEHLTHLRRIFERFQQYGLRLAPSKCQFGKTSIQFLGHEVTEHGNHPQQRHLTQIRDLRAPSTRKGLRKLLGLCNWLREYVPRYAEITAPMTNLLSPKKSFSWNPEAQQALVNLKHALDQPLQLDRPHPDLPYVLQTDASGIGAAAVLFQTTPDDKRRIISYASTRFGPAEQRYHSNEQECLAAVWAIRRYRPYLEDRPFTLRTDNRALTWLNQMKDQRAKLTRWSLLLQEFNFNIEHCPGHKNELPDALSRGPDTSTPLAESPPMDRVVPPTLASTPMPAIPALMTIVFPSLAEEIREAQRHDADTQQRLHMEESELPPNYRRQGEQLQHGEADTWCIYVPTSVRPRVIHDHHDPLLVGHPGAQETLRAIRDRYYWPNMKKDVEQYVRSCPTCARTKAHPKLKNTPLRSHHPTSPWDIVALDWMGPYPRSSKGKRFLLVVTDLFTRWTEAFPTSSSKAIVAQKCLETEVFPRFGYPRALLTDNAPQFTGRHWTATCREWKTLHWTTPVYHPRANPTERRNQELKKGLRIQLQNAPHNTWDKCIPSILFTLRSRRNAATGTSPSQAVYGRNLLRPGQWQDPTPVGTDTSTAAERNTAISQNQDAYQAKYSDNSQPESPRFQEGDMVFTKEHHLSSAPDQFNAGFAPKYAGPYPITKVAGPTTYWVDKGNITTKYHIDQLQPSTPRKVALSISSPGELTLPNIS